MSWIYKILLFLIISFLDILYNLVFFFFSKIHFFWRFTQMFMQFCNNPIIIFYLKAICSVCHKNYSIFQEFWVVDCAKTVNSGKYKFVSHIPRVRVKDTIKVMQDGLGEETHQKFSHFSILHCFSLFCVSANFWMF